MCLLVLKTQRYISWEEADKGKIIYEVSIKSLDDEELSAAWDKVQITFDSYKKYCVSLSQYIKSEGLKPFQRLRENHIEEEKESRELYYSSVAGLFRRINELRSQ